MPTRAKAGKRTKPKSQSTQPKKKRRKKPVPISLPPKRRAKTDWEKRERKLAAVRAKTKDETKAKLAMVYDCELTSAERFHIIVHLENLGRARTPSETRLLKKLRVVKGRAPDQAKAPRSAAKAAAQNNGGASKKHQRNAKEAVAMLEKIANRRPREENAGRMFYKVRRDAQETVDTINERNSS